MNEIFRADLFVEDNAHESVLRSLIEQIAQKENYVALQPGVAFSMTV